MFPSLNPKPGDRLAIHGISLVHPEVQVVALQQQLQPALCQSRMQATEEVQFVFRRHVAALLVSKFRKDESLWDHPVMKAISV